MFKAKLILEITILIFLIFIAFLISLHLPGFDWETDYGHYYYISMFNEENKEFYNDFFIHKGPVAIFVLDLIGFFIGYGWKESIIFCILISINIFFLFFKA